MGNGQSELFQKRFVDSTLIESSRRNVWHMYNARTSADIAKLTDNDNEKIAKQEAAGGGGAHHHHQHFANGDEASNAAMAPLLFGAHSLPPMPIAVRAKIARIYTHCGSGDAGGGTPVTLLRLNTEHFFVPNPKAPNHHHQQQQQMAPKSEAGAAAAADGGDSTNPPPLPSSTQQQPSMVFDKNYKIKYRPAILAKYVLEWLMQHPHHGIVPIVDVACFNDISEVIAVSMSTQLIPSLACLHRFTSCEILYGLCNTAEGLAHLHKNGFVHRNVGWHSVVVNASTSQKYFQLSEFQFAIHQSAVLQNGGGVNWLCNFLTEIRNMKEGKMPGSVAPEDKDFAQLSVGSGAASVGEYFATKVPMGASDVFNFGQMIEAILPVAVFHPTTGKPLYPPTFTKIVSPFGSEDCSTAAVITQLRHFAKQCQHDNPMSRPKITDFFDLPCVARGVFTKIMLFCDRMSTGALTAPTPPPPPPQLSSSSTASSTATEVSSATATAKAEAEYQQQLFIHNLKLKRDEEEKILFFYFLHIEMLKLPYELVVSRLLPRFLTIGLWREAAAEPFLRHLLRPLQKFSSEDTKYLFKLPMEPRILKAFKRAITLREEVDEKERRKAEADSLLVMARAEKGLDGTSANGGLTRKGRRREKEAAIEEEDMDADGGDDIVPRNRDENDEATTTKTKKHSDPEEEEDPSLTWVDQFVMKEMGVLNPQEFHKFVARQLQTALNPTWVPTAPPTFLCLILRQAEFFIHTVDVKIIFDHLLPFTVATLMHSAADVCCEALRSFSLLTAVIFNAHEKGVDTNTAIGVIRQTFDTEIFNLAAYERVPCLRNMALTMVGKCLQHHAHPSSSASSSSSSSATALWKMINREKCVAALCVGLTDPSLADPRALIERVVARRSLEVFAKLMQLKSNGGADNSSSKSSASSSPSSSSSSEGFLRPFEVAECVVPSVVLLIQRLTAAKQTMAALNKNTAANQTSNDDSSTPARSRTSNSVPSSPPLSPPPPTSPPAEDRMNDASFDSKNYATSPLRATKGGPSNASSSSSSPKSAAALFQDYAEDPYLKKLILEQKMHLFTIHHLLSEAQKVFEACVIFLRDAPDKDLRYETELAERIARKKAKLLAQKIEEIREENKKKRKQKRRTKASGELDTNDTNNAATDGDDGKISDTDETADDYDDGDEEEATIDEAAIARSLPTIKLPPAPKRWSDASQTIHGAPLPIRPLLPCAPPNVLLMMPSSSSAAAAVNPLLPAAANAKSTANSTSSSSPPSPPLPSSGVFLSAPPPSAVVRPLPPKTLTTLGGKTLPASSSPSSLSSSWHIVGTFATVTIPTFEGDAARKASEEAVMAEWRTIQEKAAAKLRLLSSKSSEVGGDGAAAGHESVELDDDEDSAVTRPKSTEATGGSKEGGPAISDTFKGMTIDCVASQLFCRKSSYFFSFDDYDNEWNNAPLFMPERAILSSSSSQGGDDGASSKNTHLPTPSMRPNPLAAKLPSRCGLITSAEDDGEPISKRKLASETSAVNSKHDKKDAAGGDGGGMFGGSVKFKTRRGVKIPAGFDLVEKKVKEEEKEEKEEKPKTNASGPNTATTAPTNTSAAAISANNSFAGKKEEAHGNTTGWGGGGGDVGFAAEGGGGNGGWGNTSSFTNNSSFNNATNNGEGEGAWAAPSGAGGGFAAHSSVPSSAPRTPPPQQQQRQQQQPAATKASTRKRFMSTLAAEGGDGDAHQQNLNKKSEFGGKFAGTGADDNDADVLGGGGGLVDTTFTWSAAPKPSTPPPPPPQNDEGESQHQQHVDPQQADIATAANNATKGSGGGGGVARRKRMQIAEDLMSEEQHPNQTGGGLSSATATITSATAFGLGLGSHHQNNAAHQPNRRAVASGGATTTTTTTAPLPAPTTTSTSAASAMQALDDFFSGAGGPNHHQPKPAVTAASAPVLIDPFDMAFEPAGVAAPPSQHSQPSQAQQKPSVTAAAAEDDEEFEL